MNIFRLLAFFAMVFMATIMSTSAHAQATRTWVSGVGDDVNPCSRTAPCKTFAGAISKTAAGGEINCLDPGGFGAVTITKSMTISCPYTEGGALAGGNGIVVNLPSAADSVVLRGLDIFGVNPPSNGVRFIASGTLHIEDSVIRRFNATNSNGVNFAPSGAGQLFITNTTITQNGNAATGGGILVQPTGALGSAKVVLDNVRVHNNASTGLRVDSTGNTNTTGITVVAENSSFSGNATGIALVSVGTNPIGAMLVDSIVSNNTGAGIIGNGAGVLTRVGDTSITGNAQGVVVAGGSFIGSFGTNRLVGNPTNNTFSGVVIPQN